MHLSKQNIVILMIICLMVSFSSLSKATTFFLIENPDCPPPHNVGDEFNCEIRIDATTASGSEDPGNLQPIKAIGIHLIFDSTKITPVNSSPFTQGNYPPGAMVFTNERTDNVLKFEAAFFGAGGGSREENNGLITTVRFRQIVHGAAPADFANLGTGTYYTAGDDPAQIVPTAKGKDLSLPVFLSQFDAIFVEQYSQVIIKWRTESEVNNVGFALYRGETQDGDYVKIAFVKGAYTTGTPSEYQYIDEDVEKGKTYFYFFEDVDGAGNKSKSEIVQTVPGQKIKAITWGQIKSRIQ